MYLITTDIGYRYYTRRRRKTYPRLRSYGPFDTESDLRDWANLKGVVRYTISDKPQGDFIKVAWPP